MKELRVGIIGYGNRLSHMSKMLRKFDIPMRIQAVADPRMKEIQAKDDPHLAGTRFFPDADAMLKAEKFDGIMIGTHCHLHTDLAIKASKVNVPLFIEKPIAITIQQLRRLDKAFRNFKPPTVVSFPLRLSPLVAKAKEMIADGIIGTVENFDAFNDVPYGDAYLCGEVGNGLRLRMDEMIAVQAVFGARQAFCPPVFRVHRTPALRSTLNDTAVLPFASSTQQPSDLSLAWVLTSRIWNDPTAGLTRTVHASFSMSGEMFGRGSPLPRPVFERISSYIPIGSPVTAST